MDETKKEVVTPHGGLLLPFVWKVTKGLRRSIEEESHPVRGMLCALRDNHTAKLVPADLSNRRVVVMLDMLNAGMGDRVLLMQLAHAASLVRAKVTLVYTCPESDPAYPLKPQQTARFLLRHLAPPRVRIELGSGGLRRALEDADYLVWAHNVPNNALPVDLAPAESFATWARAAGLDLAAINEGRRELLDLPLVSADAPLAAFLKSELPFALLQLGAGTNAALLPHAAALAVKYVKVHRIALVTFGTEGAYFESNEPDVPVVNFGNCSLEDMARLIDKARRGFGPESGPLHLAGLLGTPWTIAVQPAPFADWWRAHYTAKVHVEEVTEGLLSRFFGSFRRT